MGLGDYDQDEYERRERMTSTIDAEFDDARDQYEGEMVFDSGESAEDLLSQIDQIKSD